MKETSPQAKREGKLKKRPAGRRTLRVLFLIDVRFLIPFLSETLTTKSRQ